MRAVVVGIVGTLAGIGTALAADRAVIGPPPVFNWSGHYAGIHGLYGSGFLDQSEGPQFSFSIGGVMGGGQIGWNWQNGRHVFGIEASASLGGIGGSNPGIPTDSARHDWLAMLRGKVGYAFEHPLLTSTVPLEGDTMAYAIGGVVFSKLTWTEAAGTNSDSTVGWTIGVGVEKRFQDHLSLTLEYDYVDFGRATVGSTGFFNTNTDAHIFKVGLNFRNLWNH